MPSREIKIEDGCVIIPHELMGAYLAPWIILGQNNPLTPAALLYAKAIYEHGKDADANK